MSPQDLGLDSPGPESPVEDDGGLIVEDLGSLQQYISLRRLSKDATKLVETIPIPYDDLPEPAFESPLHGQQSDPAALGPEPPDTPRAVAPAPRRRVLRLGDQVSLHRSRCPRQLQLLQAFADGSLQELPRRPAPPPLPAPAAMPRAEAPAGRAATAPSRPGRRRPAGGEAAVGARPGSSKGGQERASTAPAPSAAAPLRPGSQGNTPRSGRAFKTSFDYSFVVGIEAKPRPEKHHLLSRIQKDDEVEGAFREMDVARTSLTRRLEDLRSGVRFPSSSAFGATGGGGSRPATGERQSRLLAPGPEETQHAGFSATSTSIPRGAHARLAAAGPNADLKQLLRLMDPEGAGSVPCGVFSPLLFWLGLAQHQNAALATLRLAFGAGEAIPMAALVDLSRFAEVQLRLAEGLRRLARLESLMPLCEFLTECDGWRLRSWFRTMRHDLDGRADVAEVQRWLAQTEIIADRQALFRFLCQTSHGEVVVNQCSGLNACRAWAAHSSEHVVETSNGGPERFGEVKHRGGFSLDDFASLLCRCTIAWCVHRTMALLLGPAHAEMEFAGEEEREEDAEFSAVAWGEGSSLTMRWTQLQRRIAVSLLVNSDFWGRESRAVLSSTRPAELPPGSDDVSAEQWNRLFQRARAQGLASTLPGDGEAAETSSSRRSKTRTAHLGRVRSKN